MALHSRLPDPYLDGLGASSAGAADQVEAERARLPNGPRQAELAVRVALAEGDRITAWTRVHRYLEHYPEDPGLLEVAADIEMDLHGPSASVTYLNQVVEQGTSFWSPYAYYRLAVMAYDEGDFARCVGLLTRVEDFAHAELGELATRLMWAARRRLHGRLTHAGMFEVTVHLGPPSTCPRQDEVMRVHVAEDSPEDAVCLVFSEFEELVGTAHEAAARQLSSGTFEVGIHRVSMSAGA